MTEERIKINLQLFAEDIEEPEEVIEPDEVIPEEPIEPDKKPDDRVPLSEYLRLKNELKTLKKNSRQAEEKNLDNEYIASVQEFKTKFADKLDDDLSDMLAKEFAALKKDLRKSKTPEDLDLDDDLQDLTRDTFYKDAPVYKKEIQSKVNEFKSKGVELSAKEAYNLVRGDSRIKELLTDHEQKAAYKKSEVESKSVPSSSSAVPKKGLELSMDDKKALKRLQENFPDRGWTEKKYYETVYTKYKVKE